MNTIHRIVLALVILNGSAVFGANREDEIVARIEKVGGTVQRDDAAAGHPIIQVNMVMCNEAGDAEVKLLKAIQTLKNVDLPPAATDASLEALSDLPDLIQLSVADSKVTDEGLKRLKKLKLQRLFLMRTRITDKGIAELADMSSLQDLFIDMLNVTDAGLAHLKGLKNLKTLWISNTHVTDAGLDQLTGLTNLEELRLIGQQEVTDEGIPKLAPLKKLKLLDLSGTSVTKAGAAALKEKLPRVKIERL